MAQEPKKLMNPNRAHGNYKNRISMVSKAYKPLPTDNLYVKKVKGRFNPRVRPGGETAETKEQAMKIEEPKKPPSSWNLFLAEKNRKEAVITLAALPDSAKKPFEDKASEVKKKYAGDLRAFLWAGGTKKSSSRARQRCPSSTDCSLTAMPDSDVLAPGSSSNSQQKPPTSVP